MADLSDVIKRLEENNKKLAQLIAEKEKEDTKSTGFGDIDLD